MIWILVLLVSCIGLDASRPVLNQELSNLFNELWRLDTNRMSPGVDYTLSVQGRAGFVNLGSLDVPDHASLPLFSNVNETKLQIITTYSSLIRLLDNYERSTGVAEQVTTEEQLEISQFLDAVMQTPVMKRAHQYLVNKRMSNSDLRQFKTQLNLIWFHLYHRQRNSPLDSSGFEHVFVGETRSSNELIGFHNWVQFYLQEKNQHLDYKGYKAGHHDLPDQDDHVLNLQFTWHGIVKPVGSAFIGTSPEFEMALYTVVFLMNTDRSTNVLVNIDQCQMELVVIRHGRSIETAYPKLLSSNSRHVQPQQGQGHHQGQGHGQGHNQGQGHGQGHSQGHHQGQGHGQGHNQGHYHGQGHQHSQHGQHQGHQHDHYYGHQNQQQGHQYGHNQGQQH